jgi:hypothetical protein
MTGLNLESFLHLLRADVGAWTLLGLVLCVILVMVGTSWGSRRALRKCLALSVTAHLGLALYGSTFLLLLLAIQPVATDAESARPRIRQIRVTSSPDEPPDPAARTAERPLPGDRDRRGTRLMPWDRPRETLVLAEAKVDPPRPAVASAEALVPLEVPAAPALPVSAAAPESQPAAPATPESRARPPDAVLPAPPPDVVAPASPGEIAAPVVAPAASAPAPRADGDERLRPERAPVPAPLPVPQPQPAPGLVPPRSALTAVEETAALSSPTNERRLPRTAPESGTEAKPGPIEPVEQRTTPEPVKPPTAAPVPEPALPEVDVRRRSRPEAAAGVPQRSTEPAPPIALARVIPGPVPGLSEFRTPPSRTGRPLADVPPVYRSRLDPNRSELAQRAGASPASEQAVERALDWLARHQDADGRWDGATAKYDDGSLVKSDDDYTIHCPPGEPCFGECIYWEADTALTGLALLAFLGSGYTQADGKYADTVGRGIGFLLLQQKPDGDLRGRSRAVGMYCHAMATLALCEAYALTGDTRLREPVERAITYLIGARAKDGLAWRYDRGFSMGDTSILGWVVMALKSAKVVGIPGPDTVRAGALGWLEKVSGGAARGLGRYQPQEPVTPTMTAEAWVCRQFLGTGGPGAASTEAADYLLAHSPARDPYNLYYWYYGTLALYQHGGDAWTRWNAEVRDQVVERQHKTGHKAGSWDPDDSLYGAKGGRIYCTALATLTLEVYYRYLRLYDDPQLPTLTTPSSANPPRR